MLEQRRYFQMGTEDPTVYTFAVYSYQEREYVYLATKPLDVFIEWFKSIGIFFGNIYHNLFEKCINVLVIKLLSACGVKFKKDEIDKANLMWECGTPWKALLALIVQIFLNILSILTFGLFTTELNRLSGYVEMKTLGDEGSEFTLERRQMEKKYLAPCQQPFAILRKGSKVNASTCNTPINLFELISEDQKRKVRSKLAFFINS